MKTDVAVIGGGSAGLAAAVTAARTGARVTLIERQGMLGGMATSAQVHSICGLYQLRTDASDPLVDSNPGFPKEFAEHLLREGGARGPVRMGRLDVVLHQPAYFAHLADRYTGSLPNLSVCLHSEIQKVDTNGRGRINLLTLRCRGSRHEIEPAAVIDTTGDAEIARLAGVEYDRAPLEGLQRPAYIVAFGGVAPQAMADEGRMLIARMISYAVTEGRLPEGALGMAFRAGVLPQQVWGTIDLAGDGFDPCDPHALSQIESEGRAIAISVADFLKKNIPGFEHSHIAAFPARAGIRESLRIRGIYELSGSDILQGARFEDQVALSSWPMELRETAKGPRFRFPEGNRSCGIPLRSLRSSRVENLLVAGRCLSSSHEAQAAIRVIGTCMATGEAAGRVAADMADSVQGNSLKTSENFSYPAL